MISKYMYDKLKEKGYPVVLTRTDDETLNPTDRVNRILSAYGNDPEVIVISNHINSSGTPTSTGAEVIYALRNESTLAQNILDALGNAGLTKRSVYQRRLPSNPNQDYYFIHRETGKLEPLLVEYGFDKYLDGDMQKDVLVNSFDTSYFGTTNDIKKINNIKRTEIYTDSEIIVVHDGYLDIGLCDTMEDLIIDMIGSCFGGFVLFGYKKRLQLKSNL